MEYNCTYSKLEAVHRLQPNPKNPNQHSQRQIDLLAKIIDYQGFRHPIVVSKRSGFLVAGHGRLEAAIKLGLDQVPIDEQDFESEAQEHAFMIADNKIAELAESDDALIKELALELPEDLDLDVLGIPEFTLDSIAADAMDLNSIENKSELDVKTPKFTLYNGDCLEELKKIPENSIHAVVTDPPYGISFMSKTWDYDVPSVEVWKEVVRVLKPGGHVLSFSGTRTYHRMVVNMEDAGLEIRDQMQWLYGSGFPKSHDILKSLSKGLKCELKKESVSNVIQSLNQSGDQKEMDGQLDVLGPVLVRAKEGGSLELVETVIKNSKLDFQQLKEVIGANKGRFAILTAKLNGKENTLTVSITPTGEVGDLKEETDILQLILVKENIDSNTLLSWKNLLAEESQKQKMSTILMEIEKTIESKTLNFFLNRNTQGFTNCNHTALKPANEPICLAMKPISEKSIAENVLKWGCGALNIDGSRIEGVAPSVPQPTGGTGDIYGFKNGEGRNGEMYETHSKGRFPANIILDEEAAEVLDAQSGESKSPPSYVRSADGKGKTSYQHGQASGEFSRNFGDKGGASRFFYVAKTSKAERNDGLEGMPLRKSQVDLPQGGIQEGNSRGHETQNFHPTVKPQKLMQYLVKLITPPNGMILDLYMGSGSTGIAAITTGFRFTGIEREPEYFKIAKARIENADKE